MSPVHTARRDGAAEQEACDIEDDVLWFSRGKPMNDWREAMTHTSTEQPEALRDYDVCVIFDASRNVTVMARTPEEAAELAEDEAHGAQHLCCQCSGQLDTGDAIGSHVYEGGTEVLDSTAAGELRIELAAAKARIAELEASQARVPLTDAQIKEGRNAANDDPDDRPEPWAFRESWRSRSPSSLRLALHPRPAR